jgi:septum formation protein
MTRIFLASTSSRRKELLSQLGVEFDVLKIDIDETPLRDEKPESYVQRMALEKANAGWELCKKQQSLVIAADTSVIIDQQILGKPCSEQDAEKMLISLSGRSHQVMSSVAVMNQESPFVALNVNTVRFSKLTDEQIEWYLNTREGIDKAGSYAVQGLAAQFIEHIEGSYSGIMGLPLYETALLLKQAGYRYE